MAQEPEKPADLSREQLQRMRGEVCSYIDRHRELVVTNPTAFGIDIDREVLTKRGFGTHLDTLYQGDTITLTDDYRLFRFVKAANLYRQTDDEDEKRRIAEDEFVPYMEYLMNVPQTPEERAVREVIGYQPLDEMTKEEVINNLGFHFWCYIYPPTFSPEFKEFMMGFREQFLYPPEIDPASKTPLTNELISRSSKAMAHVIQPPNDVIREDFLNLEKIEFEPEESNEPILNELHNRALEILASLDEFERKVCILRWGLVDGGQRTVAETAHILGITMKEVRKIESEGFRKIQNFKAPES